MILDRQIFPVYISKINQLPLQARNGALFFPIGPNPNPVEGVSYRKCSGFRYHVEEAALPNLIKPNI